MIKSPLVSVIIPVYNVEKYLKQCLDSVINQTLKDIEIICVDDGSTDDSLNILNDYASKDDRFIIITQKNEHAGVARNVGIEKSSGKYLSFLDSDDFFEPNMLEDMYNLGEKDSSDIVVCGWNNYDNQVKKVTCKHSIESKFVNKSPFVPEDIKEDLFTFCKPNPWTKLYRKSLFIDNDLHFEDFISCNDLTCVCTALFLANKISIINKQYINYRSNQTDNLTAKRNKHFDCFIFSINKLKKNLEKAGKYETYKKTLLKRTTDSIKWELSRCNKQQQAEYPILIKYLLDEDLYNILYKKDSEKVDKELEQVKILPPDRHKNVLIYEGMGWHGECLPSYYGYFKKLDYDIDFIIERKSLNDKPLYSIEKPNILVTLQTSAKDFKQHIKEISNAGSKLFKYDFYFIATLNEFTYPFVKYLIDHGIKYEQILVQSHRNKTNFLKDTKNDYSLLNNGFTLTPSTDFSFLPPIYNNTKQTKEKIKKYFDKINILITGLDKIHLSYFTEFIKVVDELNNDGLDIKVNVTGARRCGDYKFPLSKNLKYLGRVNFEELANLYLTNDFLMTFFNSENIKYRKDHLEFLNGRISGSRNMSVIYGIPLLLQEPYQKPWGLDDSNSICYKHTEYKELLMSLFTLPPKKYNDIIENLLKLQNEEVEQCVENIRKKTDYIIEKRSLPDLVYIVKPEERNEDLKYSLRSIDKFVPHNRVWIVGYKPSWVNNVGYIPVAQTGNKWKNSVNNIIKACECEQISDNFILMNDDFFAIKPVKNIIESINVSLGLLDNTLEERKNKKNDSSWGKAFGYVNELLESLGVSKPYYNYESHTPILINKNKYLEIMELPEVQDFMKTSKVLHKRSLYKNIDKIEPKILSRDVKLSNNKDDTDIKSKVCEWLSVFDDQVGNSQYKTLNKLLRTLFPNKCIYEQPPKDINNKIPTPPPVFRATSRIQKGKKYY